MHATGAQETARKTIAPRQLASTRRLMLIGAGLFAVVIATDLFLMQRHAITATAIRCALMPLMIGLWWMARTARSWPVLASWVCLEVLLIAVGISLSLHLDPSRLMVVLNAEMLLIIVSAPGWARTRYFVANIVASVAPPLLALAMIAAEAAIWYDYIIYLGAAVLAACALRQQLQRAARASAGLRSELERRAVEDALTGILNRAGWNKRAPPALRAANDAGDAVSLIYLDLDNFKSINDHHGHGVGDAVIEHAARLIRDAVRQGDLVARLGGEEFAVLLPRTELRRACAIAERIRADFQNNREPVAATLSAGVATRAPGEDLAALMVRADTALLQAKRNGRNRIERAQAQRGTPGASVSSATVYDPG